MSMIEFLRNLYIKINPLLKHPEYKKGFYRDICYTNYTRLRLWSYFLILFALSQLYSDLTITGIYALEQTEIFLKADIVLAFLAVISATESISANGLPTFLISVFSAATIFYIRGTCFFIFLLSSLGTLYFMLNGLLLDKTRIMTEYYSVIALVVIAWVVSKVIFTTRLNTFVASKQLELTNLNLDISLIESNQLKINNLLRNAFKFTYHGKVEFGYEAANNEFLFFVSDTGIGIDSQKREIIFERFRQGDESLKRSYGGIGLGLTISKGIVEQLGGKIWLDTLPPEGSKFCFTIPVNSSG